MHGSGTVVDMACESVGHDYVYVQFDKDNITLQFAADIFLDRSLGGSYFTQKVDNILKPDLEIKSLLSVLRKTATSPIRSSIPVLHEKDYWLCFVWAGHPSNRVRNKNATSLIKEIGHYDACRLMSARVAELTAIHYYNAIGHKVEDISITQLNSDPLIIPGTLPFTATMHASLLVVAMAMLSIAFHGSNMTVSPMLKSAFLVFSRII